MTASATDVQAHLPRVRKHRSRVLPPCEATASLLRFPRGRYRVKLRAASSAADTARTSRGGRQGCGTACRGSRRLQLAGAATEPAPKGWLPDGKLGTLKPILQPLRALLAHNMPSSVPIALCCRRMGPRPSHKHQLHPKLSEDLLHDSRGMTWHNIWTRGDDGNLGGSTAPSHTDLDPAKHL